MASSLADFTEVNQVTPLLLLFEVHNLFQNALTHCTIFLSTVNNCVS